MPFFDHNGLSFYFSQIGQGAPFIFQHGLGGNVDQIIKIYSPPPGVQLITFDFRGHGKTPMGMVDGLNFKTFADDVAALMDNLQLNEAIIGGISMGAAVALNFTLRYPDKVSGLILSRPAWLDGPMEQQNRALFQLIAQLMQEHGAETGRQLFIASDTYRQLAEISPGTAQSLLGQFDYETAAETAVKLKRLPEDAPGNNRNEWKNITAPTLILANKSDSIHPFEYGLAYASNIVHADFKEITAKSINEDQHNRDVQKYLDHFLSSILERYHAP